MGWDISYHPINEKQINSWYFDVLDNQNLINTLAEEHSLDDFYKDKYIDIIKVALETSKEDSFDMTHGYYVAVVQGFFNKYFYTRGAALSFLEQPFFEKYYKKWDQIIDQDKYSNNISNSISTNYSSGVYIPANMVVQLLQDYDTNAEVKSELDNLFSYDRIIVFLKALNYAKEHNLGLLEATEVVEPNPMDLNKSACYSNLFNCDLEGALLYQQAALEQLAEIEKKEGLPEGHISSKAEYEVTNINPTEVINPKEEKVKKSFWKRLLGK
ncbi:MAG: hypothetical protein ABJD66_12065 [Cellulophaga sp.]|uniref:hypothetical protein n=1 Tax=Cellulophaga sp. TaxID=1972202 RepID=UPI0032646ADB